MKCQIRNRILFQFSAQYQNMSPPFDCIYSDGDSSTTTKLVLVQQTDRDISVGNGTVLTLGLGRSDCCHMYKSYFSRFLSVLLPFLNFSFSMCLLISQWIMHECNEEILAYVEGGYL